MEDQKVNVNLPEGQKELVIRTGKAQEIRDPSQIVINGNINAPFDFISKKKDNYDVQTSTLYVENSENQIQLLLNEKNHVIDQVSGKIILSDELTQFRLNSDYLWQPKELLKLLKRNRYLFADRAEGMNLIKELDQYTAKVIKTATDTNDFKGNIEKGIKFALESISISINEFVLYVPIFKGSREKIKISVEIAFDIVDQEIRIYLLSDKIDEILVDSTEKLIDSQIEAIKNEFDCAVVTIS